MPVFRVLSILVSAAFVLGACGTWKKDDASVLAQPTGADSATSGAGAGSRKAATAVAAHGPARTQHIYF
jgi:hypothetical protein